MNLCFILLELSESKTTRNCDVASIRDFLIEITTFMANITFVTLAHLLFVMCVMFVS